MAHSIDLDVARTGNDLGRLAPAARVDEGVPAAVDDEGGEIEFASSADREPSRMIACHLPTDTFGAETAVVGGGSPGLMTSSSSHSGFDP